MALRALIAGGTGLVGSECLRELLMRDPYSRVVALTRRPLAFEHPKLVAKQLEFTALAGLEPEPADVAFCALGTTLHKAGGQRAFREVDRDYVAAFARYAQRSRAQRFLLVSALGASPRSPIFYSRVKGEAEAQVLALGFPSTVIARPALITGERAEPRPAEQMAVGLMALLGPLLTGPLKRYRPVPARAIGRALAQLGLDSAPGVRYVESHQLLEIAGSA